MALPLQAQDSRQIGGRHGPQMNGCLFSRVRRSRYPFVHQRVSQARQEQPATVSNGEIEAIDDTTLIGAETDRRCPIGMLLLTMIKAGLAGCLDGPAIEVFMAYPTAAKLGFRFDGVFWWFFLLFHCLLRALSSASLFSV
jgi:hypothetical protein